MKGAITVTFLGKPAPTVSVPRSLADEDLGKLLTSVARQYEEFTVRMTDGDAAAFSFEAKATTEATTQLHVHEFALVSFENRFGRDASLWRCRHCPHRKGLIGVQPPPPEWSSDPDGKAS